MESQKTTIIILLVISIYGSNAQQSSSIFPGKISSVLYSSQVCPTNADGIQARLSSTKADIGSFVDNTANPYLDSLDIPPCPCGASSGREWTKIVDVNMSDLSQSCPSGWTLNTGSIRSCGRTTPTGNFADSITFSTNGLEYSHVCGRITAYQVGFTDAFWNYNEPIESANTLNDFTEFDGIQVTHGPPNSRQHIWTFVAALYDSDPDFTPPWNCFCTNSAYEWRALSPPFIGNDYFCDTGNPGPGFSTALFDQNPLWDGVGCPSTSTCCQFNRPPYFCKSLPQSTSDDLELRMRGVYDIGSENMLVTLMEIYVR